MGGILYISNSKDYEKKIIIYTTGIRVFLLLRSDGTSILRVLYITNSRGF